MTIITMTMMTVTNDDDDDDDNYDLYNNGDSNNDNHDDDDDDVDGHLRLHSFPTTVFLLNPFSCILPFLHTSFFLYFTLFSVLQPFFVHVLFSVF